MKKLILIHGLLGSKNNFEYMEKGFSGYCTESIELVGFGSEPKPDLKYDLGDFLGLLEQTLGLNEDSDMQFILIGHFHERVAGKRADNQTSG
ncbi:MAG TPA: hypothetical protein ENJ35_05430 [Gammaproteobacteria bacterium]|nr:hypothetical protein [Gammaproteobacteria bacterium]